MEYRFVVFLYAYLHQINLSLDRSRWEPIAELRAFYKNQIPPKKVADYLLQKFCLNSNKLQYLYYVEDIRFLAKVQGVFLRIFRKESFLTENELYYCCQKLFVLSKYLKSDLEIHKLEIERLRIEFSKLTYGSIKFKLSAKDRDKAHKIEHFLQNENLTVISIDQFTNGLNI